MKLIPLKILKTRLIKNVVLDLFIPIDFLFNFK